MLVSVNDKSLYTSQVLITQLCTRAFSLKVGCCAACWLHIPHWIVYQEVMYP